jgi:two-component system response regulator CpxR
MMNYEPSMRALLIDDDKELTALMQEFLGSQGFSLDVAHDGTHGLAKAIEGNCDIVLLDGMLPGLDGLEVLRQLRRRSAVPVIMLTARGAPGDRIAGLDTGADDYLTKPFGPEELVARIRAVLRRAAPQGSQRSEPIAIGALRLDPSARQVFLRDEPIAVTGAQFDILEYLMRNGGRAVSRDELTSVLHQRESTPFERWLDVHISQLRKRIEADGEDRIQTVRGVGYLFRL